MEKDFSKTVEWSKAVLRETQKEDLEENKPEFDALTLKQILFYVMLVLVLVIYIIWYWWYYYDFSYDLIKQRQEQVYI